MHAFWAGKSYLVAMFLVILRQFLLILADEGLGRRRRTHVGCGPVYGCVTWQWCDVNYAGRLWCCVEPDSDVHAHGQGSACVYVPRRSGDRLLSVTRLTSCCYDRHWRYNISVVVVSKNEIETNNKKENNALLVDRFSDYDIGTKTSFISRFVRIFININC